MDAVATLMLASWLSGCKKWMQWFTENKGQQKRKYVYICVKMIELTSRNAKKKNTHTHRLPKRCFGPGNVLERISKVRN